MGFFTIVLPLLLLVAILIGFIRLRSQSVAPRAADGGGGASNAYSGDATLFAQLGGAPAVDAAIDIFYRRVLNDPYVVPFFEGVDMEKQAAKQKAFLTMAFGGPHNYTGKDMRVGHKHLIKMGLDDTHFDHILMHIRSTLAQLGVANDLITQVIAVAESTRDDVLDRQPQKEDAYSGDATLFAQLGGAPAVDAAIDIFYRRVLNDPYVVPFFEGVDMEKQAAKQKAFLTMAFGGPHNYTGKDMRVGHKHLIKMGLDDTHFDHILMHIRSTLAQLGVANDLITQVIAVAESTRDDVLDR